MEGVERQREVDAVPTQMIPALIMGHCDADLVPVELGDAGRETLEKAGRLRRLRAGSGSAV